jgi:hypothetical protein
LTSNKGFISEIYTETYNAQQNPTHLNKHTKNVTSKDVLDQKLAGGGEQWYGKQKAKDIKCNT